MTEIRPWLEASDAPAHLRDLLREAEATQPLDARTRGRSKRRLIAMSALPAAAGIMFWVKSIALGAVLGGAVVVAAYAPRLRSREGRPGATATPPSALATGLRRSVPAARDASVENDAGIAATAVPSVAPTTRSGAAVPSSTEPSQLSRETRLLERARDLMSRDARQALVTLNAHRREFPHGALELERELMAVDALLRLGQQQEARRRATQLRERAPGSIYEQRLTRLLGEGLGQPPL